MELFNPHFVYFVQSINCFRLEILSGKITTMSLGSSVVIGTLSLPLKVQLVCVLASMLEMSHWKKLEVDLAQDESLQLQNLGPYHLPLLQPML